MARDLALEARAAAICEASRRLRMELTTVLGQMYHKGYRFPQVIDYVMRDLEQAQDRAVLLFTQGHIIAEDYERGNNSPGTRAEAPKKD